MPQQESDEAFGNARRILRSYADASLDAIYVKDRNSRWLFANPALERITGKPAADLLGKTDIEIYSNLEIGKAILANDRKVMESGKPETFEEFVDLSDGRHFFISVKSPRFDEKGNVNGLLGISHDITNRKRREEQLCESQQKYKALIETTSDFVWEIDPQGRYTYCSPQMEILWGLKPTDMIGKTPFDQMPPGAREEGIKFFESYAASKKPFIGMQVPSFDGQGDPIYIEISGVPFFDGKGELLGYRGITRDTTERKKTEQALQTSEEQFRKAIKDAPIPVIMQTEDGEVLQISRTWTELTGYTITHVRSFDEWVSQAVYGKGADQVRDHLHELFKGNRRSVDMEFAVKTIKGGERVWSFSASSPGTLMDGRRFIIGMALDITDRKKAIKRLKRARDDSQKRAAQLEVLQVKLEETAAEVEEYANRMEQLAEDRARKLSDAERLAAIGATAGMVGHDIRNPLQAISGDIYLALKELTDLPDSEQKQSIGGSLEGISKSVDYIGKIVQDLQDFARPLRPAVKETDLESVFDGVLVRIAVPQKIRVTRKIRPGAGMLITDPDMLKRILANLVNNAVQAMPHGGKLGMHAFQESNDLVITVEDTGVGIPMDVRPKLFTPLFTTKARGQGFGLAAVKRLTEALGGTVSYESEIGKGTKFIVRLPLLQRK